MKTWQFWVQIAAILAGPVLAALMIDGYLEFRRKTGGATPIDTSAPPPPEGYGATIYPPEPAIGNDAPTAQRIERVTDFWAQQNSVKGIT